MGFFGEPARIQVKHVSLFSFFFICTFPLLIEPQILVVIKSESKTSPVTKLCQLFLESETLAPEFERFFLS